MTVGPQTPLKGIIGQAATRLASGRDLHTVEDLLGFLPRRYTTWTPDLSRLHVGMYAVVVATVRTATARRMKQRRGTIFEAIITDGTQNLGVTFFNNYGHATKLVPGARAVFAGQVTAFRDRLQLAHPDYELLEDAEAADRTGLLPVYSRVPRIQNWTIVRSVERVLDVLDEWPDPVPADVRSRRRVMGSLEAVRALHLPTSFADVQRARERMRFEEAFLLQTALATRRAEQAQEATTPRAPRAGGLLEAFDARLPWALTAGQKAVSEEIAADLARPTPMNRLLQGEVGSGKTVVAVRAMLAAVDSGGQAALLAPTEVLAAQHLRSIRGLLGPLAEGTGLFAGSGPATEVVLLTGGQSTATRRTALLDIASGQAGIVVGTHALIQDKVSFADLALVVVDEQHRFGVEQRDALRGKGNTAPHVLVMTATPIPRTVAMTVFGDMDTSMLRELPHGRSPIATHVVPESRPGWLDRTWGRVAEEVRAGRQAYVVCPRIHDDGDDGLDGLDELAAAPAPLLVGDSADPEAAYEPWEESEEEPGGSPARPLRSVLKVHDELTRIPSLAGLRTAVLHGELPAEEKDAVMTAFARGGIDVLVATTVVEVGVDVPNATVMVILDADRFGVSQLHQLRGRVGRGEHPGLCLLVSASTAEPATQRLDAVAATTDGFELATLDVEQRREGDILGAAQHGRTSLRFLRLARDEEVIGIAREDAFALVEADPALASHPDLAAAVRDRLGPDRAAFLERG